MKRDNQDCGISRATLLDYQEGRADTAASTRIGTHLAEGCTLCAGRLATMARVVAVLPEASRAPEAVPEIVREKVRSLFRERYPKTAPLTVPGFKTAFQQAMVAAHLVFDSGAKNESEWAGARGGSDATHQTRQFLYRADSLDIDLWLEKENAVSWYLIGQVLQSEEGSAPILSESVTLTASESNIPLFSRSAASEGSEFHLAGIPTGVYTLHVQAAGRSLVVTDLTVGG